MLFFFKRKPLNLDCFTYRASVYDLSPIVKGSECLPDWWRHLPQSSFDYDLMKANKNIKACHGFLEYHANSICLRLWSDLAVRLDGHRNFLSFQFSDKETEIQEHGHDQYPGFLDQSYQHIKIVSPWFFRSKEDTTFAWVGNIWSKNLNNNFAILPGAMNFEYQHGTHINGFFKFTPGEIVDIMFEHNTPMANLFPMTEREVKVHNHLVDIQEWDHLRKSQSFSFFKSYLKGKRIYQDSDSCPFHRKG